ncbi:transglutaminase-like cysteine peptidase [Rhizobium sp. C1]|uniref:transglutaminase-like cysteine peptidase n=1 Tax=Rhizobium sp. C1 TaxID=1349799 RepID=UPI001E60FAEC|nr:transglutaminase-like cysteine peptidase [Rhizobium sp. C1]MCD2178823.1 transglutaminase-like cysteine peptidase [Rhizobium sp. C1]
MLKSFLIAFSTIAVVMFSASSEANAFGLASAARDMAPRHSDARTLHFQIFCLHNPGDCRRSRLSSVAYHAHIRHLLAKVNDQVNRQIKPREDKGPDVWTISGI